MQNKNSTVMEKCCEMSFAKNPHVLKGTFRFFARPFISFSSLQRILSGMAATALVLSLTACNMADEFSAPQVSAPVEFKGAGELEGKWKDATPAENIDKGEWWKIFGDENLNVLQEEMRKNNNDLAAAQARIKQFAALADYSEGELLPVIDGGIGLNRQKTSQNTTGGGFNPDPYSTYAARLGVSYELDIMGKVRNNVLAAEKDFESSQAAYNNIMLLLQADLASTYFALQATDEELNLVRSTIKLREEQNGIIKKREELGAASGLETKLSDTELANIKLTALELDKDRAKLEHALAVLLGKAPAALDVANKGFNFSQPKIRSLLPAEVLQRRPDVAAAIRGLEAQNARVGIARAAWFPDIFLTAETGLQSEAIGDLFKWSSKTWLLGPAFAADLVSGALFSGGRFEANTRAEEAEYEAAIANYRTTVLNAFREVEDNLSDLTVIQDQLVQADAAYISANDAERMTKIRYDEGGSSYFDLKDAEFQAITAGRQRIQIRLASMLTTISLIKSLGGGWDAPVISVAPKQAQPAENPSVTEVPEKTSE